MYFNAKQTGTCPRFSDEDTFLLHISFLKTANKNHAFQLEAMLHHPQGTEWHFRVLIKLTQKSEVAEERGESKNGKERNKFKGILDTVPRGKSIIPNQ
jgi:hypothetical protein